MKLAEYYKDENMVIVIKNVEYLARCNAFYPSYSTKHLWINFTSRNLSFQAIYLSNDTVTATPSL